MNKQTCLPCGLTSSYKAVDEQILAGTVQKQEGVQGCRKQEGWQSERHGAGTSERQFKGVGDASHRDLEEEPSRQREQQCEP